MLGLLIAVILSVLFVAGFLVGTLAVIAVRINLEDKAARRRMLTTQRLDGAILLHEEPRGSVSRGVRWLAGAGQRNGPGQLPR